MQLARSSIYIFPLNSQNLPYPHHPLIVLHKTSQNSEEVICDCIYEVIHIEIFFTYYNTISNVYNAYRKEKSEDKNLKKSKCSFGFH